MLNDEQWSSMQGTHLEVVHAVIRGLLALVRSAPSPAWLTVVGKGMVGFLFSLHALPTAPSLSVFKIRNHGDAANTPCAFLERLIELMGAFLLGLPVGGILPNN
jgi:hypothetical protein